jgi:hypothetical protein
MVKELARNGVEYEALLETCVGDLDHCSNGIPSGSYEPTKSIIGTVFVPPGNKVLIGIGIIGDGRLDKGIVTGPHDRLVRTEERAIDRNTLSKYFRAVCADKLVPGNQEFVSLTVECGCGRISTIDARWTQEQDRATEYRTLVARKLRRVAPRAMDYSGAGFEVLSLGSICSLVRRVRSKHQARERAEAKQQ